MSKLDGYKCNHCGEERGQPKASYESNGWVRLSSLAGEERFDQHFCSKNCLGDYLAAEKAAGEKYRAEADERAPLAQDAQPETANAG
jgi:hypothetical protein